jgi:hypothetical protein
MILLTVYETAPVGYIRFPDCWNRARLLTNTEQIWQELGQEGVFCVGVGPCQIPVKGGKWLVLIRTQSCLLSFTA